MRLIVERGPAFWRWKPYIGRLTYLGYRYLWWGRWIFAVGRGLTRPRRRGMIRAGGDAL